MERKKRNWKSILKQYILMTIGVMLVALSFSFFLDPYNLVIGGVGGIAIIFKQYMDTSLMILIINVALLILALILLGKQSCINSIYGSLMFPVFTKVFNLIYEALKTLNNGNNLVSENNMLLITLIGAIIMGIGLGVVVKYGGTTGGTEIPQNIVFKYWKMPYSLSLFLFDGTIVLLGFIFVRDANGMLQYEYLLYAIIFIYLSGLVMDQIVFRGFNKRAVSIISEKNEEIKEKILHDFNRGVTVVNAVGGYTGEARTKLVCVLSTSQFYRLKAIINEIDPHAFYYVVRANEVGGEGFTYDEV